MLSGGRVVVWVGHQGQVVGQVGPLVMDAGPLEGHSNIIGAAPGSGRTPAWVAAAVASRRPFRVFRL
jgi:hypothetical protein